MEKHILCPFCDNRTATIEISYNRTKFCHCDNCGEEFIPSWMIDYNVEILRKKKQETIMDCKKCMEDAPHNYCCKCECGEHEFCDGCEAECRGTKCPNCE